MRKLITIMMSSLFLLLSCQTVNAKKVKMQEETPNVTFQILPELPKDNIGGVHSGYFNLKLKPNKTRKIRIKVLNPTDKALTIQTQVSDGTMDSQLQPTYLTQGSKQLLTKNPLSKRINVARNVKLAAGAEKWLTVTIKGGAQFKGQQAAAVNLISQSDNQGAIRNRFVYTVAIIGNGQKIKQYQKLKPVKIATKLVGKKPAIVVGLKNPDPTYLTKGTLKTELVNQKWHFFSYQNTHRQMKVVPSVAFNNNLFLGSKRLVPGVYRLKIDFKSSQYHVKRYRYVKITKKQAAFINRNNAAYLLHRNQIIIGVIVVIVLVGLVVIYFIRKKRGKIDKSIN